MNVLEATLVGLVDSWGGEMEKERGGKNAPIVLFEPVIDSGVCFQIQVRIRKIKFERENQVFSIFIKVNLKYL